MGEENWLLNKQKRGREIKRDREGINRMREIKREIEGEIAWKRKNQED